jgi:hypothetical protein
VLFSKIDPIALGEAANEHTRCLPMHADTVCIPLITSCGLHANNM